MSSAGEVSVVRLPTMSTPDRPMQPRARPRPVTPGGRETTFGPDTGYFQNSLRGLLEDPNSFQRTPGFEFALDTGLEAVNRSNSRQRGSGNALLDLTKFATGLANQEYGSQVDRMGNLLGQEQQFDLGTEQNRLTEIRDREAARAARRGLTLQSNRDAMQGDLEGRRLALDSTRSDRDFALGQGQLDVSRRGQDLDFTLGTGRLGADYDLGRRGLDVNRERNVFDYDINRERNRLTGADQRNRFAIESGRLGIDAYDSQTRRGAARSNDWFHRRQAEIERNRMRGGARNRWGERLDGAPDYESYY